MIHTCFLIFFKTWIPSDFPRVFGEITWKSDVFIVSLQGDEGWSQRADPEDIQQDQFGSPGSRRWDGRRCDEKNGEKMAMA